MVLRFMQFESMFSGMFGAQQKRGRRVRMPVKIPKGFKVQQTAPKAKEDDEWETEEEEDVQDGNEEDEWEDEETHGHEQKIEDDYSSDDDDEEFLLESAFMMPLFIEENLVETDCMSMITMLKRGNSNVDSITRS